MSGRFWTDERKALARKYFIGEGLSAELTAQKIGAGCNRSMVCGIIHRMRHNGEIGKDGAAAPIGSKQLRERVSRGRKSGWHKQIDAQYAAAKGKAKAAAPRPRAAPPTAPVTFEPSADELVIPLAERKTLFTLVETSCRWPIGDPKHVDFHFCGKTKVPGLPYCEFHARRAFQSPPPRRRAPALITVPENENAPACQPERRNPLVDA